MDSIHLDAVGTAGEILLLWGKWVMEKIDEEVRQFSTPCKFQCVEDGFVWIISGVYGPNRDADRSLLWDELVGKWLN